MLNITGNNVKLWKNEHDGRNGKFYTYSIGVNKKVGDRYVTKSVKVRLAREIEDNWSIPSGAPIDFEGFPTLEIYTDREGNERRDVIFFIQKLALHGEDDYSESVAPF